MNGETFRAADWGAASARLGARVSAELSMIHPADVIGDVGVASGGLLIAVAAEAFSKAARASVRQRSNV